jgi:hypothetical protein
LLEITAARISQPDLSRRADKQARTEPLLQARHGTADGRRIDAGRRRGDGEALGFGRKAKQLDAAEQEVSELTLHGRCR